MEKKPIEIAENRRVLIVDDNASLHEDFRKVLVDTRDPAKEKLATAESELFGEDTTAPAPGLTLDFELDFAFQGEEAYRKVVEAAERGNPYALVFMDVRMPPGWDGISTIHKIWEKVPSTEVVICTAYSDYSLGEIITKLGRSDRLLLLKKPFDSVEVQQMAIALTRKWNLESSNRHFTAHLEQIVQERTQELDAERMRNVHRSKLVALGEMAGGIAHEINTPLAVIHSFSSQMAELLREEPLDKVFLIDAAQTIESTVQRIAKIVSGLRSFSRSGEKDPFQPVSVRKLIDETLSFCKERFKSNGINLTVGEFKQDLKFEGRITDISQVLLNLLNNAHDAVEALGEKWIRITVAEAPDQLEIQVTDSGQRISSEVQQRLFQPFFTTKEVGKGTGLGLSISLGIVRNHGGELKLDGQCENTRFLIQIPKKRKGAPVARPA